MTGLVVLPGLDGTATLHVDFVDAIGDAFAPINVVAYPVDRVLDYAGLEAMIRAQLPAAMPFVLLAESFSGPIGISIAANPPSNLVGLVLSTTFARFPHTWISSLAPLAVLVPPRAIPNVILNWWLLGRWTTKRLNAQLQNALLMVSPTVFRSRLKNALSVDVSVKLRKISVPTIYLRAKADRLLSRHASDAVSAMIPQCEIVAVEGPHLLLQANSMESAIVLSAFLARLKLTKRNRVS